VDGGWNALGTSGVGGRSSFGAVLAPPARPTNGIRGHIHKDRGRGNAFNGQKQGAKEYSPLAPGGMPRPCVITIQSLRHDEGGHVSGSLGQEGKDNQVLGTRLDAGKKTRVSLQ